MQKIFVKGYINRALCSLLLGLIVLVYFITKIVIHGGWDGDANQYTAILGFEIVLLMSLEITLYSLPDYLYIAPISVNERIALGKKMTLYNNISFIIPITIVGLIPPFIYGLITNIGSSVIWSIVIFIIIVNNQIIKDYIPVIKGKKDKNTFQIIYIYLTALLPLIGCMGLENFKFTEINNHIGDVFLSLIVVIISFSGVIYCNVRHSKEIFSAYADYETIEDTRTALEGNNKRGTV